MHSRLKRQRLGHGHGGEMLCALCRFGRATLVLVNLGREKGSRDHEASVTSSGTGSPRTFAPIVCSTWHSCQSSTWLLLSIFAQMSLLSPSLLCFPPQFLSILSIWCNSILLGTGALLPPQTGPLAFSSPAPASCLIPSSCSATNTVD